MRIAVTGASGFLGQRIVNKLLSMSDIRVIAFTSKFKELNERFGSEKLVAYSRNDFYGGQLDDVDVLVNCAFPRNTDGIEMAKGLNYIADVLQMAKLKKVGAVINISSQSVYCQKREVEVDEESAVCLETTYAVGKYASELLTNNILKDIKHTNLRLASLIAVEFNQRVVNKLIDNALKINSLTVANDRMRFGFMDIDDAVDAIINVIEHSKVAWEETYNLGIIGSYTLVDIANIIKKELSQYGYNIEINIVPGENQLNTSMNCERFVNTFKFNCKYTMKDTVRKFLSHKFSEGNDDKV